MTDGGWHVLSTIAHVRVVLEYFLQDRIARTSKCLPMAVVQPPSAQKPTGTECFISQDFRPFPNREPFRCFRW